MIGSSELRDDTSLAADHADYGVQPAFEPRNRLVGRTNVGYKERVSGR